MSKDLEKLTGFFNRESDQIKENGSGAIEINHRQSRDNSSLVIIFPSEKHVEFNPGIVPIIAILPDLRRFYNPFLEELNRQGYTTNLPFEY